MSVAFPHRNYEPPDNLTPWVALLTTTVTHETTAPLFGTGSAKVVTPGTAAFEGIGSGTGTADDMWVPVDPSTEYTLSCYAKCAASGGSLRPRVTERTAGEVSVLNVTFANVVPPDTLTNRYSWTWTTQATTAKFRNVQMFVPTIQARTFWVDGWQLDAGPAALPYDGSDGATLVQLIVAGTGVSQPVTAGVRARA